MRSGESPPPRLSAHPWSLYQAEHLARRRSSFERGGFYTGMLKDDLRKQRKMSSSLRHVSSRGLYEGLR